MKRKMVREKNIYLAEKFTELQPGERKLFVRQVLQDWIEKNKGWFYHTERTRKKLINIAHNLNFDVEEVFALLKMIHGSKFKAMFSPVTQHEFKRLTRHKEYFEMPRQYRTRKMRLQKYP